ncbi:nicotinate (nicotinamide) nucleotide adenylyltransferase [Chondrinema litorale]|uniref:nicotinate (nicotinamide) nucleotide adenylyltransferase n=1 Tax=Chondrinema litorale TaxID=2994555 RepID=UPI0025449B92|nr:nicotinate (nicotinamide) nucleotide adenylyltransferase [Chondrinema litorale]UZR95722.1 nicotinate (nicotinamide) nucleotide adenylyltransferase [Chondrinema litorale]
MKVGLFFGSFNPIHVGHLILANAMVENANLDQVWFVVSPQNPFKRKNNLLHEFDRFSMVRQAIADNPKFNATDIEFNMPKPSYTADTLAWLTDKYPKYEFVLIVGEDNLNNFHKWKNHDTILNQYGLLVYPRPNSPKTDLLKHPKVNLIDAPMVEISATFIRNAIKNDKSIKYLVPEEVEAFIKLKRFYKE